jgi:tetratricopeptide (TPR) repeat protein
MWEPLWEPLLEAVAQAPSELIPDDTELQAYNCFVRAQQYHDVQDVVKSIVLYTWLLTTSKRTPENRALIQNNLGIAYRDLPGEDRGNNFRRAIACYEAALQVQTREAFPVKWAMIQNNLGSAYGSLPGGDRGDNLRRAIACYEAALEIFQHIHADYYAFVINKNVENARNELQSEEDDDGG